MDQVGVFVEQLEQLHRRANAGQTQAHHPHHRQPEDAGQDVAAYHNAKEPQSPVGEVTVFVIAGLTFDQVVADRKTMEENRQEGKQDAHRGHDGHAGEHAKFFDRQNIAGVERAESDCRGKRSQSARPPTMPYGGFGRPFEALLTAGVAIVIDGVDGPGESEHVNHRRHRHQDGVDRTKSGPIGTPSTSTSKMPK